MIPTTPGLWAQAAPAHQPAHSHRGHSPSGLTLIHLISIPVTNTSVNPARSTATAVFVGGWALQQLWLFWVAPVIGAAIAGFASKAMDTRS